MLHSLRWPDDFTDPTPGTEFDSGLVDLFNELTALGVSVHADSNWSLFGFARDFRSIDYIRRGRTRVAVCGATMNRETYWEVWPVSDGKDDRLGPYFGLDDCACIVVCGLTSIRTATIRWLAQKTVRETIGDIECWDRSDPSSPLRLQSQ